MAGEQELLAEVERVLDAAAERDLQRDLGTLLARTHVLVARAWDEPETPERRAQLQELHDRLATLAAALEGEAP
jgi:hypothetical protein